LKDGNADKRAKAVRSLGLLPGNADAERAAINALQDKKPNVRTAAAAALGSMQAHGKTTCSRSGPGYREGVGESNHRQKLEGESGGPGWRQRRCALQCSRMRRALERDTYRENHSGTREAVILSRMQR